jgi:hypothetical protein
VISRDRSKGRSVLRGDKPTLPAKTKTRSQEPAVKGWFPLPSKFENPQSSGLDLHVDSRRVRHDIDLP